MQMFNFEFIDGQKAKPLESRNQMLPSPRAARMRCESLFETYGKSFGATGIRVHENGGTNVLYEWPET
jgi:hypothetical protein